VNHAKSGSLVETQRWIVGFDAETQCSKPMFTSTTYEGIEKGAADAAPTYVLANRDCDFGSFRIHETKAVHRL